PPPKPAAAPEPPRSLGARVWGKVTRSRPVAPTPPPAAPAVPLRERLATWCREDERPAELAAWADVVVAMDDAACRSVWELGRRVPGVHVNRAVQAREALEAEGVVLPPPSAAPAGVA